MADNHDHDHDLPYESASLVGARLCKRCGGYVSGLKLNEHERFHDSMTALIAVQKKGKKK